MLDMEQTLKRIDSVRAFIEAANRQFEEQGIYLGRVLFKRDKDGFLTAVILDYEDRQDTGESSPHGNMVKEGGR